MTLRTLVDPVLVAVFALQLGIAWRCWILARGSDSDALDRRRRQFEDDIRGRARRGDGPDWVRYMDEADRVHERRVDRLRVWATGALALGIGGTMAVLAYRLNQPSAQGFGLLVGVAPALLASFTGVLNNLFISLRLFYVSDRQFEAALDNFRKKLQNCSNEHTPPDRFATAVREQLGEAFREAVRSFPEAFARLDDSVQRLSEVVAKQSQSMLTAAVGLTEAADKIVPAAERLHGATDELRALPDRLRQTLDETRAAWQQEMRRDEEAFIGAVRQVLDDQHALLERTRQAFVEWERGRRESAEQQQAAWRETVDLLQKSAAEIVGTVERLPAAFAETAERLPAMFTREVERISAKLGEEFTLGARQHIADLTKEIREGSRKLGAQIEESTRELQNRFLNETARVAGEAAEAIHKRTAQVAGEAADEVHRRVGEPLLSALQAVSRGVEEALRTLPENARTFADSLSAADGKLKSAIDRLGESADHLQQVAKLTKGFENALARALEKATVRSFEPVRRDMKDVAAELKRIAGRSGPEPSVGVFRRLLRRLWPWGRTSDRGDDKTLRLK